MMRMTETVKQLLIINIIFFVGTQFVPQAEQLLSLHYFESSAFRIWQPLTHMFMHGNIGHIFFNMFALYSFGSALEQFWGSKKFLFFYFSCGLGAALLHSLVNYYNFHSGLEALVANGEKVDDIMNLLKEGQYNLNWEQVLSKNDFTEFISAYMVPAVGASGAIYGLLTAFAFMFPNAELALMFIPIPVKAKYFVPGLLAIDLFLGLKGGSIFGAGGTGIAHFAHIGGAIVGFIMMWYWKKNSFNDRRWN